MLEKDKNVLKKTNRKKDKITLSFDSFTINLLRGLKSYTDKNINTIISEAVLGHVKDLNLNVLYLIELGKENSIVRREYHDK